MSFFRKPLPGQRKPCNCTKSMCLKLYCDCFANGEFCLDCNCKDCHNNLEHEADRSKAIKLSLERNPNAFKPKIGGCYCMLAFICLGATAPVLFPQNRFALASKEN